VKVFRVKYSEYGHRVEPLLSKHWEEVGMPGTSGLLLDPNRSFYENLENNNMHIGVVCEKDDQIVGYLSVVVFSHHHHKSTNFAATDVFFIDPAHRGIASFRAVLEMFKLAQDIAEKEYAATYFQLTFRAHTDLSFLAETLGFVKSDVVYTKKLR
jgi:hypothetical protein